MYPTVYCYRVSGWLTCRLAALTQHEPCLFLAVRQSWIQKLLLFLDSHRHRVAVQSPARCLTTYVSCSLVTTHSYQIASFWLHWEVSENWSAHRISRNWNQFITLELKHCNWKPLGGEGGNIWFKHPMLTWMQKKTSVCIWSQQWCGDSSWHS